MKTRVYITVDVECAEERGLTGRAQGYDIRFFGRFGNQREDLGIGFLMRELEAQGLRATFFTEALGTQTFGEDGLRTACSEIVARGHDVQLHAHPVLRSAHWRTRDERRATDDIGAYSVAAQADMLREATAILVRCGAPSVKAFRAGNFGASNETWEAMAEVGLVLSSSYNRAFLNKSCQIQFADAGVALFPAEHGVWELPISTFEEHNGNERHLQISAVSFAEMVDYLQKAHVLGMPEVTFVTHSFEFFHVDSVADRLGRPNLINAMRLRRLCRYLRQHDDSFEVETVGALAGRIEQGSEVRRPPFSSQRPHGSLWRKMNRIPQQVFKRIDSRSPWMSKLSSWIPRHD